MATMTGGILGHAISGKSGNAVFVNVNGETRLRARVVPHNPQTPAQQAGRRAHGRASGAWSALPVAARRAWDAWARAQGGKGQTTFVGLYAKMLRLDAAAVPPASPPALPFYGDAVTVTICGSPSFACERGGWAERVEASRSPSPNPFLSPERKEGEPGVTFAASGPNRAGVVTELLVQPLLSAARRTYLDKYRGAAYVAFAAGRLSVAVPVQGRHVAVAYRFVEVATGRQTALVELGVVEVGA